MKDNGQIEKFVEKPKMYVGNKINAGIYIFNPSILDRIEVRLKTNLKIVVLRKCKKCLMLITHLLGFLLKQKTKITNSSCNQPQ